MGIEGIPLETHEAIAYADTSGRVVLPILIAISYGVYLLVFGSPGNVGPYLVAGGFIAIMSIWATPFKRYVGFATLIPKAYAVFLILYLGLWCGWLALRPYHGILPILAAVFWVIAGWRAFSGGNQLRINPPL